MESDILGICPEMMEQLQRVGEYFTIEIRNHRDEGRIEVRYVPTKPCPDLSPEAMIDELSAQLAWAHAMAFSVKGTITDAD